MAEPDMPQMEPYAVEVEKGRSYLWCRCGKSATVCICGCKRSGNAPLCDGTHQTL